MTRWLETFPVPEESPAPYVRDLRFSIGICNSAPEKFFEHTPWFTNVERITFWGYRCPQGLRIPSFWRLPESVTSLTIGTDSYEISHAQDIIARLPNLDNLSISGCLVTDRMSLSDGPVVRGKFGGKLQLLKGNASADIANVLLKIPTGLHFTEVDIESTYECLLSTVRLVEACTKSLVKISYMACLHRKSQPSA